LALNSQIPPFLQAKDKVSHPYKITSKIIILYKFMFQFLNRREEDEIFRIVLTASISFLIQNILGLSSFKEFVRVV
jgi:hypothetical protein